MEGHARILMDSENFVSIINWYEIECIYYAESINMLVGRRSPFCGDVFSRKSRGNPIQMIPKVFSSFSLLCVCLFVPHGSTKWKSSFGPHSREALNRFTNGKLCIYLRYYSIRDDKEEDPGRHKSVWENTQQFVDTHTRIITQRQMFP